MKSPETNQISQQDNPDSLNYADPTVGKVISPPDFALAASPMPPPAGQTVQKKEADKKKENKELDISDLEYKSPEIAFTENLKGSLRLTLKPKNPALYEKKGDFHKGMSGYKIELGPNPKAAIEGWGKGLKQTVGGALVKGGVNAQLIGGWLKVKFGVTAFEAKIKKKLSGGVELDASLLKINGDLEGTVPKDVLLALGVPKNVVGKFALRLTGKLEYNVPVADLAKLRRAQKAMAEASKAARKMAKSGLARKGLEKELTSLNKQFKGRNGKAKAKLKKKIGKIKGQMKILDKNIKKLKNKLVAAQTQVVENVKGLKSKAGKKLGGVMVKTGLKNIAKFIPFLNIISNVADVWAAFQILKLWSEGIVGTPDGTGDPNKVKDKEAANTPGSGGSKGGEPAEAGGPKSGGTGGETAPGTKESAGGGTPQLPEELKNVDPNDPSLYEEVEDTEAQQKKMPNLSAAAQEVFGILKSKNKISTQLKYQHLHELNEIIPQNLNSEQLKLLKAELKRLSSKGSMEPDDLLGSIMRILDKMKNGTKSLDLNTKDYKQAGPANLAWQSSLGWTVPMLSGNNWKPDSKEFIDYVFQFQHLNYIDGEGICGPKTTMAMLAKKGLMDSEVYKKAMAEISKPEKKPETSPKARASKTLEPNKKIPGIASKLYSHLRIKGQKAELAGKKFMTVGGVTFRIEKIIDQSLDAKIIGGHQKLYITIKITPIKAETDAELMKKENMKLETSVDWQLTLRVKAKK